MKGLVSVTFSAIKKHVHIHVILFLYTISCRFERLLLDSRESSLVNLRLGTSDNALYVWLPRQLTRLIFAPILLLREPQLSAGYDAWRVLPASASVNDRRQLSELLLAQPRHALDLLHIVHPFGASYLCSERSLASYQGSSFLRRHPHRHSEWRQCLLGPIYPLR